MQTAVKVKSILDTEVKNLHSLLQQLSVEERINYVKGMIPCLLSIPHQINSGSQRLTEKHLTPFNNLTKLQSELIADLSSKTENLYKLIGEEN